MIALDTNQLEAHALNSPPMALLRKVANRSGHRLALPSVVLDEHCAHYENSARSAYKSYFKAQRQLEKFRPKKKAGKGGGFNFPSKLDDTIRQVVKGYRDTLVAEFEILELDGESAMEALRREAFRLPPAATSFDRPGTGARDAAIWLSLLRCSADSSEFIYFVSADKAAFSRPELDDDVQRFGASIRVLGGVGELLEVLADSAIADIDTSILAESSFVKSAVVAHLADADVLGTMYSAGVRVGPGSTGWSYDDGVEHISVDSVRDVRSHLLGGEKWVTAWVKWNLSGSVDIVHYAEGGKPLEVAQIQRWLVRSQVGTQLLLGIKDEVETVEVLEVGRISDVSSEHLHSEGR